MNKATNHFRLKRIWIDFNLSYWVWVDVWWCNNGSYAAPLIQWRGAIDKTIQSLEDNVLLNKYITVPFGHAKYRHSHIVSLDSFLLCVEGFCNCDSSDKMNCSTTNNKKREFIFWLLKCLKKKKDIFPRRCSTSASAHLKWRDLFQIWKTLLCTYGLH